MRSCIAVLAAAVVVLSASTAPSAQSLQRDYCGTRHPDEATAIAIDDELQRSKGRRAPGGGTVTVPVYFHVITDSAGRGQVTDGQLSRQIQVLNQAFAGKTGGATTLFQFKLAGVDRTVNNAWFQAGIGTIAERQMKSALHQGNADTLNFYTNNAGGNLLGWATFPFSYQSDPTMDGVVVYFETLPGGAAIFSSPDAVFNYALGDTGTHEVGHWVGLFHTFQGGCAEQFNDFVSDTPAERIPAFLCTPRDSCKGKPGIDPIHNFMDYTDDVCISEFTPGQAERAELAWLTFRR